ncbi:hypothetical protein Dimus_015814, partial [Dionaea muscipula]
IFDAFEDPLDDREGDEPVKTDLFKETFLNCSQLKRKNGVWWLGSGENRRRDDEEVNDEAENVENIEANEEEVVPEDFVCEEVHEESEIKGEPTKKQAKEGADSGFRYKFYDAIDDVRTPDEEIVAPAAPVVNDPTPATPMSTPVVPTAFPASPADLTTV